MKKQMDLNHRKIRYCRRGEQLQHHQKRSQSPPVRTQWTWTQTHNPMPPRSQDLDYTPSNLAALTGANPSLENPKIISISQQRHPCRPRPLQLFLQLSQALPHSLPQGLTQDLQSPPRRPPNGLQRIMIISISGLWAQSTLLVAQANPLTTSLR